MTLDGEHKRDQLGGVRALCWLGPGDTVFRAAISCFVSGGFVFGQWRFRVSTEGQADRHWEGEGAVKWTPILKPRANLESGRFV